MRLKTFLLVLGLAWASLAPAAAFPQRPRAKAAGQAAPREVRKAPHGRIKRPPAARRPARIKPPRNPNAVLERWRRMSPEQRRKALERLSPERRRMLVERLRRLEKLTPEERRRLRRDYQRFRRLPPERQEHYRKLYQRFNRLPGDRRRLVAAELRRLRRMSPDERRQRIRSEEFRREFDERERRLLEELAGAPLPD